MERCERCRTEVHLERRTVVLSNDTRGEMREHVYCSSACAMAPGDVAAAVLEAIGPEHDRRDRPRTTLEARRPLDPVHPERAASSDR